MAALLAGLWWLLSGGTLSSWIIGIPAVLLATLALQRLRPASAGSLSIIGLALFLPFFVAQSLRGGLDVARRTLAPRMRVQPGLAVFRSRLHHDPARVFFFNCVSLLPGTLAADVNGNELTIHVLDRSFDVDHELSRLELAVARIFPEAATQAIRP